MRTTPVQQRALREPLSCSLRLRDGTADGRGGDLFKKKLDKKINLGFSHKNSNLLLLIRSSSWTRTAPPGRVSGGALKFFFWGGVKVFFFWKIPIFAFFDQNVLNTYSMPRLPPPTTTGGGGRGRLHGRPSQDAFFQSFSRPPQQFHESDAGSEGPTFFAGRGQLKVYKLVHKKLWKTAIQRGKKSNIVLQVAVYFFILVNNCEIGITTAFSQSHWSEMCLLCCLHFLPRIWPSSSPCQSFRRRWISFAANLHRKWKKK